MLLKTSRTRSPARLSRPRLVKGSTATVLMEPKSMFLSWKVRSPELAQPQKATRAAAMSLFMASPAGGRAGPIGSPDVDEQIGRKGAGVGVRGGGVREEYAIRDIEVGTGLHVPPGGGSPGAGAGTGAGVDGLAVTEAEDQLAPGEGAHPSVEVGEDGGLHPAAAEPGDAT